MVADTLPWVNLDQRPAKSTVELGQFEDRPGARRVPEPLHCVVRHAQRGVALDADADRFVAQVSRFLHFRRANRAGRNDGAGLWYFGVAHLGERAQKITPS